MQISPRRRRPDYWDGHQFKKKRISLPAVVFMIGILVALLLFISI